MCPPFCSRAQSYLKPARCFGGRAIACARRHCSFLHCAFTPRPRTGHLLVTELIERRGAATSGSVRVGRMGPVVAATWARCARAMRARRAVAHAEYYVVRWFVCVSRRAVIVCDCRVARSCFKC